MAELLLKATDVNAAKSKMSQKYDVICAFNNRAIRFEYAQQICSPKQQGYEASGLRTSDTVLESFLKHTHEFKFERVSATEIKRIILATQAEEVLAPNPSLVIRIARQKRYPHHMLFGTEGVEYWYGGRKDFSNAALDLVWADIEAKTSELEANYTLWPLGTDEIAHYRPISVDDFDDAMLERLINTERDIDDDPDENSEFNPDAVEGDPDFQISSIVRKRRAYVDWESLGVAATGDTRGEVYTRATSVVFKTRLNMWTHRNR